MRPSYWVGVTLYQQELARCGIDQQTSARQTGGSAQLPLKQPHLCRNDVVAGPAAAGASVSMETVESRGTYGTG